MKNAIVALVVGFLFAIGLGVAGMTQPQKIVGFLDLFGNWDPTLMFVMMGAIGVHIITYRVITNRKTPLLSLQWHIPNKKEITPALIGGSALFGVGWALGGYCPGPAMTSIAAFEYRPFLFVVSMFVGMFLFNLLDKKVKFRR